MRVVTSRSLEGIEHRHAVKYCPSCDYYCNVLGWHLPDVLKEIVLEHKVLSKDDCITISECPQCFEKSWIHRDRGVLLEEIKYSTAFQSIEKTAGIIKRLEEVEVLHHGK